MLNITRRSTSSGLRCASARPTTPQSCITSESALEPERVHEPLEEVGVAVDRVVELGRLGGVAEARQVGRDAAAQLEERDPVEGRGRYAVEIQQGRVARLAPVHLELSDPLAAFDDLHRDVSYQALALRPCPSAPTAGV